MSILVHANTFVGCSLFRSFPFPLIPYLLHICSPTGYGPTLPLGFTTREKALILAGFWYPRLGRARSSEGHIDGPNSGFRIANKRIFSKTEGRAVTIKKHKIERRDNSKGKGEKESEEVCSRLFQGTLFLFLARIADLLKP